MSVTDSRPLDIDIVGFDVPLDIMTSFWRRFYGSYDLTNSVIAQTHGRAHIACTALCTASRGKSEIPQTNWKQFVSWKRRNGRRR